MGLLKLNSDLLYSVYKDKKNILWIYDAQSKQKRVFNDGKNDWKHARGIYNYLDLLGLELDVKKLIESHAIRNEMYGRAPGVKVLDGGCGSGKALENLVDYHGIEKAYGISNDGYSDMLPVITKNNAEIFLGKLQESKNEFIGMNMIFDVYGAYFYSKDRLDVIQRYYDFLHIGGEAYILHENEEEGVKDKVIMTNRRVPLIDFLRESYSGIFSLSSDKVIIMQKQRDEEINFKLNIRGRPKMKSIRKDGFEAQSDDLTHPVTFYSGF